MDSLHALIRAVPDFPKPGVTFRDVTPLLAEADAFARCIDALIAPWAHSGIQIVCGIESRGFIFGVAMAQRLRAGFVPLRKPNKLPPPVMSVEYSLEYGVDRLESRQDALEPEQRVLLVDDVLATGGTLAAAASLVHKMGGELVGASVLLELADLGGRARWVDSKPLHALLKY